MPLTPNFTVSQTAGLPRIINFTDNSTGSDVAVVGRRIYIQKSNGVYIVPTGVTTSYVVWAIANASTTVDVLNKDYALTIKVDWLDVSGNILYSKTRIVLFTTYLKAFFYSLTQYQASNKSITQNNNFYPNKAKLWSYIKGAETAIELASDISGAQNELDAGTEMITSEKLYF